MIVLATLVFAAGLFALDLKLPSGAGEWGLYLIPLLLAFKARQRWYLPAFTGLCTVLSVAGFMMSPSLLDWRLAAADRAVGIIVFWITAMLLWQRREAEHALQDVERRFRAILDHAPLAIFTKDLSGRYTEFSRQCEINSGQSRDFALGRKDAELFPESLSDQMARTDKAILESGKPMTYELQFPNKDGVHSVLVIKFPLLDRDGKCQAICGMSADVTELKQAERALRQNQERLDLAQVAGRIGTFEWAPASGEVTWSPALEGLYGLRPGSFGRTYDSWKQAVHPEDRERVEREVQQAIEHRAQLDHQFRIVWPDGSVHWVRCVARVFSGGNDEAQRMMGVNFDITESKRVHEELEFSNDRLGLIARVSAAVVGAVPLSEEGRKLAEQARIAFGVDFCVIRILEGNGLVLLASAGIPEGRLQPRLPIDWSISGRILSSRKPLFISDVQEHIDAAQCAALLPPEVRYVSYVGVPLLAQDQVVGILGVYSRTRLETFPETDIEHLQIIANHIAVAIANDRLFREVESQKNQLAAEISVRKRVEEALQTLSRRLLELQESERRHIARELHDEIGQALTALKINLQAMQRQSEAAPFVPRLLDSINIVDRTLRQVRDLSLDLRPSMLDDLGLCAALRWYADQQAQRAGLRVQFVGGIIDGRFGPAVETSCFRIAQEALTNIVRHARASNVRVQLETGGGELHLLVSDDGIGFDSGHLLQKGDQAARLGLLGMEERASLIGGRIELKSVPQQGTEVHAWFPLANGHVPEHDTDLLEIR